MLFVFVAILCVGCEVLCILCFLKFITDLRKYLLTNVKWLNAYFCLDLGYTILFSQYRVRLRFVRAEDSSADLGPDLQNILRFIVRLS